VTRYGRVAERIVRTLGDLTQIPNQSMGCFRLYDTSYVSPKTMPFLHWVIFLPFGVLLVIHLVDYRLAFSIAQVERELLAYLCTSLPLLLLYYPIGFFKKLGLLPEYPLYPATIRDPELLNPSWGVVCGILSVGLAVGIGLYFLFRYVRRKLPPPDFRVSKTVLMVILLAVIVLALEYNSYWASAFLFLPAWIWGIVGLGRRPRWRLINWTLIIAAGLAYYVFVAGLTNFLYLGWNFIWYEILALSCGLFAPAAYILGAVTVAIGIRFLVIQFHGSDA
jgi:membrane-associated HD superfamily phosphohydrolase